MKKIILPVLIFAFSLPFFSGCFTANSKETKVDTAMAQGGLPSAPPSTGPGEPQKSFDQEISQSR